LALDGGKGGNMGADKTSKMVDDRSGYRIACRPNRRWLSWAAVLASLVSVSACASDDAATPAKDRGDLTVALPDPYTKRTFVFDTVILTRKDANGRVPGFDIDGKTSGEDDLETCSKADAVAPDGTVGIDNQFAGLVPLIELAGLGALEGLVQSSIDNGSILLLLDLSDVQDWKNDPSVQVTLRAAAGTPLLGTDGLLLAGQTFSLSARSPELLIPGGRIEAGVLRTGNFDGKLPIQVFGVDYELDMRKAQVAATVLGDDRLENGLVGGGITLKSIEVLAAKAAEGEGDLDDLILSLIAGVGDLAKDEAGNCTQVSAALGFTAVPAFLYPGKTGQ
jgi:hypothetical protein